jgi:hypothetical protein
VLDSFIDELGQHECAEQRTRAACEPLVHTDDRPIMLLHLLLTSREARNERLGETGLKGHVFSGVWPSAATVDDVMSGIGDMLASDSC